MTNFTSLMDLREACSELRSTLESTKDGFYSNLEPVKGAIREVMAKLSMTESYGSEKHHGLDTDTQVFFYEQDFYVLSNFSAFTLTWKNLRFDTSEAAYHWEKFTNIKFTKLDPGDGITELEVENSIQALIRMAKSAHDAFKMAEVYRALHRPDWNSARVDIMRQILRAKAQQHEYVRRKLLQTGDRELVENSWRDSFWGWGVNRDGQNMLGKLWMDIRAELRA